jgi:triosephosphate isomerase
MRKKIVAGNWKMNTTFNEGIKLAKAINDLSENLSNDETVEIVIAPPFTHISGVVKETNQKNIHIAAQNCATEKNGAFTGEVSAEMLKTIGCQYVILGHSERRAYYNENSEVLNKKINQVIAEHMIPIFCCGEQLAERNSGNHFKVVADQISEVLFNLTETQMESVVIAYEPVWAIGTGVTASKEQAQEMHAYIRKIITDKFGLSVSDKLSILYGGSVKPANAKEIFEQLDVDGGLIGGASLEADSFIEIVKSL